VGKRTLSSRPSQICLQISFLTTFHDAMLHREKSDPNTRQGQYQVTAVETSHQPVLLDLQHPYGSRKVSWISSHFEKRRSDTHRRNICVCRLQGDPPYSGRGGPPVVRDPGKIAGSGCTFVCSQLGLLYGTLRTKKDCPECLYGLTAVRFPFGQFWTVRNTETVDHPPGVTLRSARHARGRGWLTEQLSPGSQAITKIVREADSNG